MKKTALALTMALGLVAAQTASATTEHYSIKGSSCTSITSGVTGQYDIYGVSPNSGSAMNVTCPIVLLDRVYTQFDISMDAYSRSTPDKASCTLSASDNGGSGATSATAAVTLNQANSQNATATLTPSNPNSGVYDQLSLTCHIPGTTVNGPSYLTWIRLSVTY